MKYFESGKINVYPAGFRSANYKQSKLTTEENITHLQNFMSTSDGLYIDYIDYSKNHTSNDPSVVQITNKNAGAYFYTHVPEGKTEAEAKVYINSDTQISVNNDYFILRVCGYSFRFKIIDFLNLCLASPSLSGKDVYGYIYLRNTGSGPIGYVLGNVSTPSENVLDQGILFQGLGIGSDSESEFNYCYKVKIGKFDSTNHFTISYDPIQVVNATSDESGNNIKATYAHSLIKTAATNPNTNGDTLSLKNNLNENLPESSFEIEIVNAKHAASSNKLDAAPSLGTSSGNKITVTAGGRTSNALTVPYAVKASQDVNSNPITSTYAHSLTVTDATYTDDAKIYLKAKDDTSTSLSHPSLNTVKKSIISKIKNGFLYIDKSDDEGGYNIYTANLYGLDELPVGAFLTVFLAAYNESDKPVKFKLNTSPNPNDSFEEEVYLNGKACSSANKLSNYSTYYNAYYAGSHWNFTPIGEIISGTSVTLNGTDSQGKYISIYAPNKVGTKGAILLSDGSNKAPVWSNSSKGSTTQPLYIKNDGVLTAGSKYAGGTKVTLNGADKGSADANIYAAESAEDTDKNKLLKCNGKNSEPTWIAQNDLSVGTAGKATDVDLACSGSGTNSISIQAGSGTKASFTINNVTNAASATNSDFANKIKTSSKIGDVNNPVYVADDGTVTPGKSIPKLNGSDQDTAISFYAPIQSGTAGQVLKSKGSGAPEWIKQSDLSVGKATNANKIGVKDSSGAGTIRYKSIETVTSLPTSPDADTLYIVLEP